MVAAFGFCLAICSFLCLVVMNLKTASLKCRHCGKTFRPDYRNRHRQFYCSAIECRRMSKAVSQHRWLRQAQNREYFQGSEHTRRVQQWRKANPGYWKKRLGSGTRPQSGVVQSDTAVQESCNVRDGHDEPLQDDCLAQNPMLVGLISAVIGSTLQDDIAAAIHRMQIQGRKILGLKSSEQSDLKERSKYDRQDSRPTKTPDQKFL